MDLHLYYCSSCVHAYLDPIPPSSVIADFYKHNYDYYTSPLESQLTTQITSIPIQYIRERIIAHFGRKVSMVDVGGSDGYSLVQLQDLAEERLLIEPSGFASTIAKKFGVPVLEKFLDDELAAELEGKFDVVINRHVIEHLEDSRKFAHQLLKLLKPEGLLCIETPDLTRVLGDTLVRVVSLQHLNYFSTQSLQKLIGDVGSIESIQRIENYAFLACITKGGNIEHKLNNAYWLEQAKTFDVRLRKHCGKLKKRVETWKGRKIWLWGAGSAGGEIYHVYNFKPGLFAGYIDSDPRKINKRFVSAPELPIVTADEAHNRGVDAVVITSYSVKEITARIKQLDWNVPVTSIYSHA